MISFIISVNNYITVYIVYSTVPSLDMYNNYIPNEFVCSQTSMSWCNTTASTIHLAGRARLAPASNFNFWPSVVANDFMRCLCDFYIFIHIFTLEMDFEQWLSPKNRKVVLPRLSETDMSKSKVMSRQRFWIHLQSWSFHFLSLAAARASLAPKRQSVRKRTESCLGVISQ